VTSKRTKGAPPNPASYEELIAARAKIISRARTTERDPGAEHTRVAAALRYDNQAAVNRALAELRWVRDQPWMPKLVENVWNLDPKERAKLNDSEQQLAQALHWACGDVKGGTRLPENLHKAIERAVERGPEKMPAYLKEAFKSYFRQRARHMDILLVETLLRRESAKGVKRTLGSAGAFHNVAEKLTLTTSKVRKLKYGR
jgi:hypothetical protein